MKKAVPQSAEKQNRPGLGIKAFSRKATAMGLALLFGVWILLYMPGLRTNPAWYGDEIVSFMTGESLLEGKPYNRAVYATYVSPAWNYPPIFSLFAGIAAKITKGDILGPRFLSALIGLTTAASGFLLLRRRFGFLTGLGYGMILLGYLQSIIHYRWVYPHNLVGLASLGAACVLMRRPSKKNDLVAGGFLSLGATAHFLTLHAMAGAICKRLFEPKSWILILAPSAAIWIILFSLLFWRFGHWVWDDALQLADFYRSSDAASGAEGRVFFNLLSFFTIDSFHLSAFVGLFFCFRRRAYGLSLMAFIILFMIMRNRQNIPVFYYQAMSTLPLLAAVIAVGWIGLTKRFATMIQGKALTRRVIRSVPVFLGAIMAIWNVQHIFSGRLPVRNEPWVVSDMQAYEHTAIWLNQRTQKKDLVITYWNLAWLLDCKTADVLMAASWAGYPAGDLFPRPLSKERFAYPADLALAKFFVVTELDERWAFGQGNVLSFLRNTNLATWPLVYQCGPIKVFQNPDQNP